jgi:hypothetical protein
MEICTNPKEIQGREWLHLGGMEWGVVARVWMGRRGRLVGEDGGLQRVREGEGVSCKGENGRGWLQGGSGRGRQGLEGEGPPMP